jgi:hypothetical protein
MPRGSFLLGNLEIRVLEQVPRWRNPTHSDFEPLLSGSPHRPRILHQRPNSINSTPTKKLSPSRRGAVGKTQNLGAITNQRLATRSKTKTEKPNQMTKTTTSKFQSFRRGRSVSISELIRNSCPGASFLPATGLGKLDHLKQAIRRSETPITGKLPTQTIHPLHVRFFDPLGSESFYVQSWDGEDDCFGIIQDATAEYGHFSLQELSERVGTIGVGFQVDTMFETVEPPKNPGTLKKNSKGGKP